MRKQPQNLSPNNLITELKPYIFLSTKLEHLLTSYSGSLPRLVNKLRRGKLRPGYSRSRENTHLCLTPPFLISNLTAQQLAYLGLGKHIPEFDILGNFISSQPSRQNGSAIGTYAAILLTRQRLMRSPTFISHPTTAPLPPMVCRTASIRCRNTVCLC